MTICSPEYQAYLDALERQFDKTYDVAKKARALGLDPSTEVEIPPAKDVAARVEGLVGPKGIAERIRELTAQGLGREQVCFTLVTELVEGKWLPPNTETEKKIEQAVRTGLALFTEGVVSAPIEGVSRVKLLANPDGSKYVSVYFSGPIRGAGGTGQAFTLLLADYARQKAGLDVFKADEKETERYVEESNLYAMRTRAGQYVPTADEVRLIVKNCAVCIDGEPTEDYEVGLYKNLPRVETNRVRGGLVLVLSEGLCLKAAKVTAIAKKAGLTNWTWIEGLIKSAKSDAKKVEIKPVTKYLHELTAGRPIFSYPMTPGGFSLRYGRTRFSGIASKAIHPATMAMLMDFTAIGTQVKHERPGKGCITTPCQDIEGPIVRMKSGEVRKVNDYQEALAIRNDVAEILFVGDLLVNYGDFNKANHPLVPGAWCIEWFEQELEAKGINKPRTELQSMDAAQAIDIARSTSTPLHPKFTYQLSDLSIAQVKELAAWLAGGKLSQTDGRLLSFSVPNSPSKRSLELAGVPHRLEGELVVIDGDTSLALLTTLGLYSEGTLSCDKLDAAFASAGETPDVMSVLQQASGLALKRKVGTYIGTSMGRPEKSNHRQMKPPVHSLFPLGLSGGIQRNVGKAVRDLREDAKNDSMELEADVAYFECGSCNQTSPTPACIHCHQAAQLRVRCEPCNKLLPGDTEVCPKCNTKTRKHGMQRMKVVEIYENAIQRTQSRSEDVKGVMGLISASKIPEPLEKGILRAKHRLTMFRDGTVRFDATEVPITHFVPREIATSIAKLHELGYTKDMHGAPLERDDQVVEMHPQDIIVCENNGDYFVRVAQFVDDLLVYQYGLPPFYNANTRQDIIGQLAITIAPHISAGTVCRIIGYTPIRGHLMHPYLHCGIRRNCDSDESCNMMLLDALINFSRSFLPSSRGGSMDAPLVLTVKLEPKEVDDEVHAMDVVSRYPLDFYKACESITPPSEVKSIELVRNRLGKPEQFEGLKYTHEAWVEGPMQSSYVTLGNMIEKVEAELALMLKIRAVDAAATVESIIQNHFFPDLYGNLRSFTKQIFRCIGCTTRYRRVPLAGKCTKCGGKVILTITKGGIEKYLKISQDMARRYNLSPYLQQRLAFIEREIDSIFEDDKSKQFSLSSFV